MEEYNQLFLEALRASLKGEKVQWNKEISSEDWFKLLNQAQMHNVLALVYEAVYDCPSAETIAMEMRENFRRRMLYQVMQQTIKTQEFWCLQQHLKDSGFTPIVIKGIVCRNLYPKPDYRISTDEDLLIPPEQFNDCCQCLYAYGMHRLKPDQNEEKSYELSFGKAGSPIFIELHKYLFDPDTEAYGEWNRYFADIFEHKICETIDGHEVYILDYTEHLFYLICHAFKHFLHSGFGIRQVCDIVMFANAYGSKIDWQKVLGLCREIHADKFSAAIFKIGQNYLTFNQEKANYPVEWRSIGVDERAMLEDLLSGGVYGASSMSRKHSSNMTLNAVVANKKGEKVRGNVLRVVLPKAEQLEGRYHYLVKRPYLLPIAWADRLLKYRKETSQMKDNDAVESIRIGNQRIELLKQYGVIQTKD